MRPQAASRSSTPRIPRVTATLPSAGGLDFQAFLDGFSVAPSTDARTVAAPGSSPRSIEVRAGLPRPSKGVDRAATAGVVGTDSLVIRSPHSALCSDKPPRAQTSAPIPGPGSALLGPHHTL